MLSGALWLAITWIVLINDQRFDFRCAEIDTQIHSHLYLISV